MEILGLSSNVLVCMYVRTPAPCLTCYFQMCGFVSRHKKNHKELGGERESIPLRQTERELFLENMHGENKSLCLHIFLQKKRKRSVFWALVKLKVSSDIRFKINLFSFI